MKKDETRKARRTLQKILFVMFLCTFSLSVHAANVELNRSTLTMAVKGTYQLKLNNNEKTVVWSSSKNSIASVNAKGKVTAKKPGKTVITAKTGKKKYSCKVTVVKEALGKIQLVFNTKKNGKAVKVNSDYYIGIFREKTLKDKLFLRAIRMNNSSKCSTSLVVNLSVIPKETITLYIAETDKKGVPLKSGSSSGYDIRINGKKRNLSKITLKPGNLVEKIVIENSIR